MQIELGFLDHLMGLLAIDGVNGYDTRGSSTSITRARPHGGLHVLDLQGLDDVDPHAPRTADRPQWAAGRAAGAGHRRSQHRQRQHRRLFARARRDGDQPGDRDPLAVGRHGPGRPARHGRHDRDLHADPQRLPRRAVPHAEQRAERGRDPGRRARTGRERVQRALERRHRKPALELLERMEQSRRGTDERSGEGGRRRRRPASRERLQPAQRAAADDLRPDHASSTKPAPG